MAEPNGFGGGANRPARIVARPSLATGSAYKQVSKAYIDAVYAVITGQKRAAQSAAELEKQLIAITGFRAGPPQLVSR